MRSRRGCLSYVILRLNPRIHILCVEIPLIPIYVENMSTPKNHHYIPQNHIKRFYGDNNRLWYFDKRVISWSVVEETSGKIFFVKHHNTLVRKDGSRDTQIETELSKLEGVYKSEVDLIIDMVGSNDAVELSDTAITFLRHYTFLQWRRNPDFENLDTDLTTSEAVEVLKDVFKSKNGVELTDQEVLDLVDFNSSQRSPDQRIVDIMNKLSDDGEPSVTLEEMQSHYASAENNRTKQNAKISARYENFPDGNPLNVAKLWICRLADGLSFLLGSNPVFPVQVAGEPYPHALCGIVFPISKNIALVFGKREYPFKDEMVTDAQIVRRINQGIAKQSTSFASSEKALVHSFAKPIIKAHKRNKSLSGH